MEANNFEGENKMEKDFRYKMRHMGDAFADSVESLGRATRGSVRGIVLTYRIDSQKRDRDKVVAEIGKTMAAIRKDDPAFNISGDDTMNTLLSDLDRIEERIETFKSERKERLYPKKFSVRESADAS